MKRYFFFSDPVGTLDSQDIRAMIAHRLQHTIDVPCEVVETTVRGRTTHRTDHQPEPNIHALPVPDRNH